MILLHVAPLPTTLRYYNGYMMLFDMRNFTYNDTYARIHNPPIQRPVPREFTVVFMDAHGDRPFPLIKNELFRPDLLRAGDVLILNLGAHYARTLMFQDWMIFFDKFANELKAVMQRTGVTVIWRSSFLMKEHVFRSYKHHDGYVPSAHFQTDARRLLFDSYAEHVLAPMGVHIWGVLGLSSIGDYMPSDMVHTDGASIWAQNVDMMDTFVCRD